jgi:glycosyltransferase involved in cell wall biosynthesis
VTSALSQNEGPRPADATAPRRRIRVAYCLDSFAIGGTELNAVRSAEALDPQRIELCVLHLQTHGALRSRYERLGLRMQHVPIPNLYSPRTAMQGIRLAALLRRWEVDVVHSHDIYCNIFAVPWARALSGCSVIASRRWSYEVPRPGLAAVNRWSSLLAHRVLANSGGVAGLLVREDGVPRRKIVEVPNFLADSAFVLAGDAACAAQRRAWGVPAAAFVVGIVARLSPVKNHAMLLEAAAELPREFHFVLIGDGPSRPGLEALARKLGIESRVHFTGEVVSPVNLQQFFDVSVLCSSSEGFPNSLIEAMAAARPVVATPAGGVGDAVVDGISGILVPPANAAALAAALRTLAADAALRRRLGEAGRHAVATQFRQEIVIEKLSALYESLARRGPGSAARRAHA